MIADTYTNYLAGKKTVVFSASENHATDGVKAESVSGHDKVEVRNKIFDEYENGYNCVLSTCDLLNEGWG